MLNIRETPGLELLMEAALCAWEWMLENREDQLLEQLWENAGTVAMRHCAMRAGQIGLQTHELMESKQIEFHAPYDWEFIPAVMTHLDWPALVEHDQYKGPAYEPDLEAILTSIMVGNTYFQTPEQRWVFTARRAAHRIYNYTALVDDGHTHDYAEDPEAWVRRIGTKYNLTETENARR